MLTLLFLISSSSAPLQFVVLSGSIALQLAISSISRPSLGVQDTSELFFDDVRPPKSALLGQSANNGFFQLMMKLQQERLMIGIGGVAHSEWMFEETRPESLRKAEEGLRENAFFASGLSILEPF